MGAVPGGGFLTETPTETPTGAPIEARGEARGEAWFDVESYRLSPSRRAVVWRPDRRVLVLGSTQRRPFPAAERAGIEIVRRRSGGGAVLVVPEEIVWVDVWLPRGDPLWDDDVVRAAGWVGHWWADGLSAVLAAGRQGTAPPLTVHKGPSVPARWADVVCFAGVGPGEVLAGGRKLVGISQWRSRQGALFQGCCYRRWSESAGVLTRLLGVEEATTEVERAAVGVDELLGARPPAEAIVAALLEALPQGPPWDVGG